MTLNFCDWWPSVAILIARGLCACDADKRAALQALRPVSDHTLFTYTETPVPNLLTDEMKTLLALYRQKIKNYRQAATVCKDLWCNRLSQIIHFANAHERKFVADAAALKRRRREYETMCDEPKIGHIVVTPRTRLQMIKVLNDEYRKHSRLLQAEYSVAICRAKNMVFGETPVSSPGKEDTVLECDINNARAQLDLDQLKELDHLLERSMRNVDFDMSRRVARECEHWLPYLKLTRSVL